MGRYDDDNEIFFNGVMDGQVRASDPGPCPLCQALCPRCAIPMHQHTQAGLIECAWRGHPCTVCGHAPHTDAAPGRCASYTHPGDTARERGLRLMSASRRDAKGPFYAYRHCNHRNHGRPEPDDPRRVYALAGAVARTRPAEDTQRQRAEEQVAGSRAERAARELAGGPDGFPGGLPIPPEYPLP